MLKKAQEIYSKLCDDLSRKIFLERLNYSISGDYQYIEKMLDLSIRKNSDWLNFLESIRAQKNEKIVLFGNGIWGDVLLTELKAISWHRIIDNSPKSDKHDGITVESAASYLKNYDGEKIVISSYKNRDAMVCQCIEAGVAANNIIDAAEIIYSLTEGKIYFDEDIIKQVPEGILVDGGCFDGKDTERFFIKYGADAVCFEPDESNIERIKKRLEKYDKNRFRIINKGLWSQKTTLGFLSEGDYGSHIATEPDVTDYKIQVTSIDEELEKSKTSMIKMDIEGAEYQALCGSSSVIRRDHPILAISIYHKPEDIISIPECILSIYEGYKFYLRHYSFSWYDTVLYALPIE